MRLSAVWCILITFHGYLFLDLFHPDFSIIVYGPRTSLPVCEWFWKANACQRRSCATYL